MDKVVIYNELKGYLLNSDKPSVDIKNMIEDGKFDDYPFNVIVELKNIEQNPKFHKEGNVFNHTMLVVDKASKLRDNTEHKEELMLSALLHDVGKVTTTKLRRGNWTSYNHDKVSSEMVYEMLDGLEDEELINRVSKLTLYHMQSLFYNNNLKFFDKESIINNVNIDDLILLTTADRTGRVGIDENAEINSVNDFKEFLNKI